MFITFLPLVLNKYMLLYNIAMTVNTIVFNSYVEKPIITKFKNRDQPMVSNWLPFLYVGVGGFAGATLRYSISLGLQKYSIVLPYGTLLANFIGCFAIGIIVQIAENTEILSPEARLLLATGFCGGLTTLSSMIFELAQLLREGELFYGFLYFLVTFSGGFLSFYIGILVIRMIFKY